jgi:hypothetical protein
LKRYRHVSLLHRDFKVEMPSGSNRHSYVLQTQRRWVRGSIPRPRRLSQHSGSMPGSELTLTLLHSPLFPP